MRNTKTCCKRLQNVYGLKDSPAVMLYFLLTAFEALSFYDDG